MLLVAMTHVSREQARLRPEEPAAPSPSQAEPEPDPADEQRRAQLTKAEDYLARLEEQHAELDQTLRDDQLKLSSAEDHIRRLTDKLISMQAAIAELQQEEAEHYDDRAQAERNLKQLEALVAETKAEIAELEAEQSERFKSYSIVPYRGANGTLRQPIYIECREDRVLLQPEGVELTADDFRKPLGVGNPLAAALRASREYYVRQNPAAGYDPDVEPYPLIIVRPDGILAYYGVREAIRSWDSDFGYEMVDADWELNFPAANPVLFDLQTRAVQRARARRELLARAAPRAYGGASFQASLSNQSGGRTPDQPYDETTLGRPGGGLGDDGYASGDGEGMPGDPANFEPDFGGAGAASESLARGETSRFGEYQPDAQSAGGQPSTGQAASGRMQAGGQGGGGKSPPQNALADGARGSTSPRSASSDSSSSNGGASGGANGAAAPGSASSSASRDASLIAEANRRGADWAVEKESPADIAIRRSVHVLVHNDRLVVLPGRDLGFSQSSGGVVGKTVPLDGATHNGLDNFVTEVRKQVNQWGMAGQGLYWRPVLVLNVAPDGSGRARDLTQLLEHSGFDVKYERTATLPTAGGPQ